MTSALLERHHIAVPGVNLHVVTRGAGRPLLFVHPENGLDCERPWADELASHGRLVAPTHPGFGAAELPRWMSSVDDIAYAYLDLMQALDLHDAVVIGVGFGGWIAAEMAVKNTTRMSHLVLADSVGIKISDRETRDIVDIFATAQSELLRLSYHDAAAGAVEGRSMNEADALALFRNREAVALFGWSPYMHDPKLPRRLHRIDVPTLVLWGESDRIVTPAYGRAFAGLIPGARFEIVAAAGHFPHLEAPHAFAEAIAGFAGSRGTKGANP